MRAAQDAADRALVETPPVTSVGCRRGGYACVESAAAITAEAVLAAVLELTKGKRS